jgi:hypothetical protein
MMLGERAEEGTTPTMVIGERWRQFSNQVPVLLFQNFWILPPVSSLVDNSSYLNFLTMSMSTAALISTVSSVQQATIELK